MSGVCNGGPRVQAWCSDYGLADGGVFRQRVCSAALEGWQPKDRRVTVDEADISAPHWNASRGRLTDRPRSELFRLKNLLATARVRTKRTSCYVSLTPASWQSWLLRTNSTLVRCTTACVQRVGGVCPAWSGCVYCFLRSPQVGGNGVSRTSRGQDRGDDLLSTWPCRLQ